MLSRFDFLFDQFSFRTASIRNRILSSFFILEGEIRDIFYETMSVEERFERLNFAKYRIVMDKNGDWIGRMLQIIPPKIPNHGRRHRDHLDQYMFKTSSIRQHSV
jgi:hypothetical protein